MGYHVRPWNNTGTHVLRLVRRMAERMFRAYVCLYLLRLLLCMYW